MSGKFEPKAGLDQEIARRFGVPAIRRALDMLQDSARTNAPETRTWVTMRDERVRPSHVKADGQTIPANLRFKLDAKIGGVDLARHPRDPALPEAQRINCRCDDPTLPHLLRESIHSTDPIQEGTVVHGSVYTDFPRAAESEFGTSEDEAAYFMTNALREVAMRLRAGHSR
jgi:hypothetical protein